MCGIAGIHIFDPDNTPKYEKLEETVDLMLREIDHRGGDATGFVAVSDDQTEWQKASCKADEFCLERRNLPWSVRSILMHTRMATQGSSAFPENNHPIRRGSVYVVHNGHIWNDHEIFRRTNRTRFGSVDSEAIAALIAKYGIMRTHEAMEEVTGAAAIGVIDETRPGLMVVARGSSSPVMFYRNEHIAVFASTSDAVRKSWENLYGTAPKLKNIASLDEGTALYLDNKEVVVKRFTPDDYAWNRSSYKSSYVSDYCETKGCWNKSSYTAAWGERLCKECAMPYSAYIEGEIVDKKPITITSQNDKCSHGIKKKEDCEICNPDDKNGAYLDNRGALMQDESGEWVAALKCDLCDIFFPETELTAVKDWEDRWTFCKDCLEEMSEIIADCDVTRPTRIHDEPLEDVEYINRHIGNYTDVVI